MLSPGEIRAIELSSFRAWPALESFDFDGWLVRFAAGLTGRSNSVNPHGDSYLPVGDKIAVCEQAYGDRGLPVRFRLTPASLPESIDEDLAARGYRKVAPTAVYVADLPAGAPASDATATPAPGPDWEAAKVAFTGFDRAQVPTWRSIVARIAEPAAFALLAGDGGTVAAGFAVAQDKHLGVFDVSVDPGRRRRGRGRRLVEHLLAWGSARGATLAYLQVEDDNAPAIALYESLGFRRAYPYWYRMKADPA